MNSYRIGLAVDIAYGTLLIVAVVLIGLLGDVLPAVTFAAGLLVSYMVHLFWRMANFEPDPEQIADDVNSKVEETVEETVEKTIDEKMGDE